MAARLLLLEDDPAIARTVVYTLERDGLAVTHSLLLRDARQQVQARAFDLLVLDVGLPDGSGLDLLQQVRNTPAPTPGTPGTPGTPSATPVLMLSARGEELDRVLGLELGADDYISKPFRLRELMARIKTVLRRSKGAATEEIRISGLTVRMKEGKVLKNGQEVILTALEYKLLLTFLQNRGRVLSRNMLLESIWDVAGDFVSDNTLSVYIKRLREKIEDDPVEPQIIKTVRGMGYKVDE